MCVCAFKKVHRALFLQPVCSLDAQVERGSEAERGGEIERGRERERGKQRERGERSAGLQIDIRYSGSSERRLDFFCFIVILQSCCGQRGPEACVASTRL